MADSKITALTALTAADPANDMMPIVDVSDTTMAASGTTKRISINNILACSPSATLASATITGDLTVATSGLKIDSATGRSAFNASTYASSIGVMQSSASYYAGLTLRNSAGTYSGSIGLDASGSGGGSQDVSLVAVGTNLSLYSGNNLQYKIAHPGVFTWYDGAGGTRMTLNSTGLGVGVSPSYKVHSVVTSGYAGAFKSSTAVAGGILAGNSVADLVVGVDASGNGRLTADTSKYLGLGSGGINDRFILDSSGNVGVGVTPSAWRSGARALQLGANKYASLHEQGSGGVNLCFAAYEGTANVFNYTTGDAPSRYVLINGQHQWYTAASGTAGNAITFTQAMTLDASGRLILLASTTTPATLSTNGQLTMTATSDTNLRFSYRGSDGVTRVANLTLA